MSVYAIKDKYGYPVYIGSTTLPLKRRLQIHKAMCKTRTSPLYRDMLLIGPHLYTIELLEKCDDLSELRKKEGEYIRAVYWDMYNIKIEGRTPHEYYEENKGWIKSNKAEYIECPCGGGACKSVFARHLKSKKHLKYVNENKQP